MKADYETICKIVPEFSRHTLADFMRVRTLVNSRIFGTIINGEENDSLAPYAGIIPHSLIRYVQLQQRGRYDVQGIWWLEAIV